jgi:hypothetical protein
LSYKIAGVQLVVYKTYPFGAGKSLAIVLRNVSGVMSMPTPERFVLVSVISGPGDARCRIPAAADIQNAV